MIRSLRLALELAILWLRLRVAREGNYNDREQNRLHEERHDLLKALSDALGDPDRAPDESWLMLKRERLASVERQLDSLAQAIPHSSGDAAPHD